MNSLSLKCTKKYGISIKGYIDRGDECAGRGDKFWNLCSIPLCLYNKTCLNQRIHAANFGLGGQRVLQTGCLSALHYLICPS